MIDIQIPNEALSRAHSMLAHALSRFPQAVARAVNRTMDGMKTDAVKETSAKYFVKAGTVRASLSFRKAAPGNLMGTMVSRGKRHSLADYKLTPLSPIAGKKTQLRGAVKKEGGLKSLGDAFLVKRAGGGYSPFSRIGYNSASRKYGGIKSLISPSMPQIIKNKETVQAMQEGAQERFSKRLEHEVQRILGISL